MIKQFIFFLTTAALISACGSNEQKNDKVSSSETTAKANQDAKDEPKGKISVTVTGGNMEGTYNAICNDACCSYGIAGEKVFGNQYSETGKGPKDLSSVQLIVNDVTGSKKTDQFQVTVSFGDLMNPSQSYNINTLNNRNDGSGTLDLNYSGDKATVHIQGTSVEGPVIDLTIQCNKVMTMQSIQEDAK